MEITRRKLIGGLGLLIAAPAIIRVAQLMPIKSFPEPIYYHAPRLVFLSSTQTVMAISSGDLYAGDIVRLDFTKRGWVASKWNVDTSGVMPQTIGVAS